ncbi:hypothetical protein HF086_002484 [Spodoptera exigua]|uniref:superoxide dismutase n=1 Tax=Spodoptera exigua TaxID=7107 RepID=A0A922MFW1_SPOEX|nr:hypothetical protein HF086_002484 [Spodoptera exigua]
MLMSKLEVLVDFGPKPDEVILNKTLAELKSQDGVKDAVYKEGAILVETALPSTQILEMGCKSIGEHYNPCGAPHGAPEDPMDRRHAGDLGNIVADETGRATFRIVDNVLKVWDIIGRSVAVTERKDDLGRGSSPSSKIDGDSGTPIACGIIARSAGVFQNPKRICACDGVVVWDEKDRPLAGKGRREEKPKRRCCENHNNSNVVNPCCKV